MFVTMVSLFSFSRDFLIKKPAVNDVALVLRSNLQQPTTVLLYKVSSCVDLKKDA